MTMELNRSKRRGAGGSTRRVGTVIGLVLAVAAGSSWAAETVFPSADGTLVDGGLYGPFDGIADDWDWTFNRSGYEGSITLSTSNPDARLEHRVVWEYDLRRVNAAPPLTASLTFTLRGAPVFPMPDTPVAVFAYPADLQESPDDYRETPIDLRAIVTMVPFQRPTTFSVNVTPLVEEAIRSGARMVAFRFQVDPNTPDKKHQAFIDALDDEPETKPFLTIDEGARGDGDRDGDVDLMDYRSFFECLSGPAVETVPQRCHVFDFDADNDVDLLDAAEFSVLFTGS